MSSNNRGDRIQLLQKVLKKHFQPVETTEGRSVLEQLLFAGCLEDARHDAAEEAFGRLQELYVDWNEMRVTTVTELADALTELPDPTAAAARIKRSLQAIFESRYSFDLEDMRKMNQGKAVQELEKFSGVSRFMLGYVTQHALGGHTIPISDTSMQILVMTGIVTPSEAEKQQTPGLERAIPKSKGVEFSSCLQQLAAELKTHPTNKNVKAILKEAGAVEIPPKPAPEPPKKIVAKAPEKQEPPKGDTKKGDLKKAPEVKNVPEAKKPDPKSSDTKKPETKKPEVKAVEAKKPEVKKPEAKKPEVKKVETKVSKDAKVNKPIKDTKTSKDIAKDTKKPTITKKSLPPKKATKSKPVTSSAKKPVVKKITKRKPK